MKVRWEGARGIFLLDGPWAVRWLCGTLDDVAHAGSPRWGSAPTCKIDRSMWEAWPDQTPSKDMIYAIVSRDNVLR